VTRKIPAVLRPVLSLVNGPTASVVTGVPTLLTEFRAMLGEVRATPGEQEPRVPHSQRKLPVRTRFLSTSAPFHNASLEPAVGLVEADLARLGISVPAASLLVPVLSTLDGSPIGAKDEIGGSVSCDATQCDAMSHFCAVERISVREKRWLRTCLWVWSCNDGCEHVCGCGRVTMVANMSVGVVV
jgi:malonyl CoA-acyl carrier protein transacylase